MKLFIILLLCSSSFVDANFFIMQSLKKYQAAQAYAQEDFSYALHCLDYCMDENPYDPECNYNVGNVLYQQRKYADAQQSFLRVVEHEKKPSQLKQQAYFNMGNSYYQMEEWQNAIDAYKEVLKINESNENARHNLQLAYYKLIEEQQREHQKKGEQQESDQHNQDNQSQENDDNNKQEDASSQNKESSNQPQSSKDEGQAEQQDFSDQESGGESQDDNESPSFDKQSGQTKSDNLESNFDDEQINSSENQESGGKGQNQDDNLEQDGDEPQDNNDEDAFAQEENSDSGDASGKKMQSASRKKELKDDLKDQYESKACDDERLDDYYSGVMKTLEEQEAKVQKYIIKNKVAMQSAGQHGKNSW